MDGHRQGDAVGLLREDAGEVRVPRVRMDDVGPHRVGQHADVAREGFDHRAQPRVDLRGVVSGAVPADAPVIAVLGVAPEAPHVDIDERTKVASQLVDVDPGPAVDLRRELVREDQGAHAPRLPGRSMDRQSLLSSDRVEDALDLAEVERLAHHRDPRPDLGLPRQRCGRAYQHRDVA